MANDLDDSDIRQWRSILTLIVFVISSERKDVLKQPSLLLTIVRMQT